MSDDSFRTSATSEQVTPENNTPNANYSRWMTDMAADIAHLILHQLAIPGAHNSGVDDSGKFDTGKKWAVCQYNNFAMQLNAGARYLDLRLVDSSYKKDVGGSKVPRYKFVEIFEFKHGIVSVGRRLETLVKQVRDFSIANPGEIVFIDFHHYDRGRNYSHTSLERCLPYFNAIKDRLIPPSASNLSIGEIRQTHPGCNIILCLDHGNPDKWPSGVVRKEQMWKPLRHEWSSNATEQAITALVIQSMKSPPQQPYWVLSAAVTNPKDLAPTHPIRTEAFKPGHQNANILMVDFIDGKNSNTGVTDRCITLNRQRSVDKSSPTAPSNFVVTGKDEDIVDGKFQNTLRFTWNPSVDNLGVQTYEIHQNDVFLAATSANPYEHKNFLLRNYKYKIRGIDTMGNISNWSDTFNLTLDTTPPTIPDLVLAGLDLNSAYIQWDPSIDVAGIKGYEVYLEGKFVTFIEPTATPSFFIGELTASTPYEIKVRTQDNNDLYSEYATIKIPPRPRLINPKYSVTGYNQTTQQYDVNVIWDKSFETTVGISYLAETKGIPQRRWFEPGEIVSFSFQAQHGELIKHKCFINYTNFSTSKTSYSYDFTFDATAPEPIKDLKIISRNPTSTTIGWVRTTSANVKHYAISVNEEPPILVPASTDTYTIEENLPEENFLIEVWAENHADIASPLVFVKSSEAEKPVGEAPRNLRVISNENRKVVVAWDHPENTSGFVQYKSVMLGMLINLGEVTSFPLNGLPAGSTQSFNLQAFYTEDVTSEKITISFTVNP